MKRSAGKAVRRSISAHADSVMDSILSETGVKYDKETMDFDLSELHLAWFAVHHLPEDSDTGQGGEGTWPGPFTSEGFDPGGMMYYGTIAFSSGMGPREEKDVPYQPKDPGDVIEAEAKEVQNVVFR